jgi:hypothetical protein
MSFYLLECSPQSMARPPEALASVEDVDCTDYQVLVTGSTSGIGREATLALGRLGADVVVHGRNRAAGEAVVDEFESLPGDAQFVQADFAEVDAVRALAETVREETDELDLLLHNAGGLFREGRLTDLGVEYTFHVNHLSSYLLTAELLDHLAAECRIVTTASAAHRNGRLDLDGVTNVDSYSAMGAYSRSKLANVVFTAELAERLDTAGRAVTANSVHPGAIPGSGFTRFLPGAVTTVVQLLDVVPFVTSVRDGAAELLYVALSDRTAENSGRYFANQEPTTPAESARKPTAGERLFETSAALLDIPELLATAAADESN